MKKSLIDLAFEIVNRVNLNGCRVSIPFSEPLPVTAMFDGSFSNAEYISVYPAALHFYGMPGSVAFSEIEEIEQLGEDKYVIRFGRDAGKMFDALVRIMM